MSSLPFPITKILVPYDGSPAAQNALTLAGLLSLAGKEAVLGLTILHVIGGGYLARHVHNVDLRVARMEKDKDWQRVRQLYLDREVRPLLAEARKNLESLGVQTPVEVRLAEGKISDEILRLARDESFSTLIMGRRGLSPLKALFVGSVTRSILTQAQGLTVYLASQEARPLSPCPLSRLLLPIDGSSYSLAAVRQAAGLVQAFRPHNPLVTLFHVVDIDLLGLRILEGSDILVQEGEAYLAQARAILQEAGLEGCWQEKLVTGQPAQAIIQEAEEGGYAMILMGSKGHSKLANLLLGSVTNSVVHTVSRAAVGVVYG